MRGVACIQRDQVARCGELRRIRDSGYWLPDFHRAGGSRMGGLPILSRERRKWGQRGSLVRIACSRVDFDCSIGRNCIWKLFMRFCVLNEGYRSRVVPHSQRDAGSFRLKLVGL